MSNPTGISRSSLRQLALQLQDIGAAADNYVVGDAESSDELMRQIRDEARQAELCAWRLLDQVQRRCS